MVFHQKVHIGELSVKKELYNSITLHLIKFSASSRVNMELSAQSIQWVSWSISFACATLAISCLRSTDSAEQEPTWLQSSSAPSIDGRRAPFDRAIQWITVVSCNRTGILRRQTSRTPCLRIPEPVKSTLLNNGE